MIREEFPRVRRLGLGLVWKVPEPYDLSPSEIFHTDRGLQNGVAWTNKYLRKTLKLKA